MSKYDSMIEAIVEIAKGFGHAEALGKVAELVIKTDISPKSKGELLEYIKQELEGEEKRIKTTITKTFEAI